MIRQMLPYPVKRVLQTAFDRLERWVEPVLAKARKRLHGQWRRPNTWEPAVGLALRDLCRPGAVVFDCGANIGGLTILMSRLVGPRGLVCAFEASPRVIDKCQANLVANGCFNASLHHAAVYSASGLMLPLCFGEHYQGDFVRTDQARRLPAGCEVPSIALDDFVQHQGLTPDLVKMDIEGAEHDAVRGMLDTIERVHPHLILETQPSDERCLHLLRTLKYRAIDLNRYQEIRTAADFPAGVGVRNLLYIHEDRLVSTGYRLPFAVVEVARITRGEMRALARGRLWSKNPLLLPPGRYLFDVHATARGASNEMRCGIRDASGDLLFYEGSTSNLLGSYRDWVLSLSRPTSIHVFFDFLWNTRDDSFRFENVVVRRISHFDSWPLQLVA